MLGFESTVDRLADAFLLLCIVELYTLRTAMQCSMYLSLLIKNMLDMYEFLYLALTPVIDAFMSL